MIEFYHEYEQMRILDKYFTRTGYNKKKRVNEILFIEFRQYSVVYCDDEREV